MFGYVTPNPKTESKAARAEYRRYYCGLCTALKKRYGARARWILSYDAAFLLLMLDSTASESARCPYFRWRRCDCACGDAADYAADVNLLLACLNFEDDIADGGSLKARLLMRVYRKAFDKAKAARPQLYAFIRARLSELAAAERRNETEPDIPADIFGRLLGEVFAYRPELRAFGESLGRAIYLIDAMCDFRSDIKDGRYNPLVTHRQSEFDGLLALVLGACAQQYEKLEVSAKNAADNVIYDGLRLKYQLKKGLYR